jgi:hypothetical protein
VREDKSLSASRASFVEAIWGIAVGEVHMHRFVSKKNEIAALFLGLTVASITGVAKADCATDQHDPETKAVYTGTSAIGSSGLNPEIGWLCSFHTTAAFIEADVYITTASAAGDVVAPYVFVDLKLNRESPRTAVGLDFSPLCNPKCQVYDPSTLTAHYTITFAPPK